MDIHVCKQCGSHFVYCRACVFRPIRYKDNGFCSKECYEASKNKVIKSKVIEEVVLVEEPKQVDEIIKEDKVETETVVPVETTIVVEPTIKKETNTYKKKKNKYQVHE
jgi:hypothetical protein